MFERCCTFSMEKLNCTLIIWVAIDFRSIYSEIFSIQLKILHYWTLMSQVCFHFIFIHCICKVLRMIVCTTHNDEKEKSKSKIKKQISQKIEKSEALRQLGGYEICLERSDTRRSREDSQKRNAHKRSTRQNLNATDWVTRLLVCSCASDNNLCGKKVPRHKMTMERKIFRTHVFMCHRILRPTCTHT